MLVEIDVEATIATALKSAMDPERITTKIEELVRKTVDAALTEGFSSYSPFAKAVKSALETVVPHELSIQGSSSFRDTIIKAVTCRLLAFNDERLAGEIDRMMGSLLEQPPEEVKLSEVIARAVEQWQFSHYRNGSEYPTIIVERTEGVCAGYHHVYMDPTAGKPKFLCRCQIDITKEGRAFSIKVDGRTAGQSLLMGPLWDFDRYLFWLHTGGTRIEVDRTNFDNVRYDGEVDDED